MHDSTLVGHLSFALRCYSYSNGVLDARELVPLQVPFQAILCCAFLVHTI